MRTIRVVSRKYDSRLRDEYEVYLHTNRIRPKGWLAPSLESRIKNVEICQGCHGGQYYALAIV